MYWTLGIIYLAIALAFVLDALRNPRLSGLGKLAWIVGFVALPVASWCVYGYIRLRQNRGLA